MIRKFQNHRPGLEVIKLEFILRLKIKLNDWLLADTCPQAANHCAFCFESENVLKFYNLKAWAYLELLETTTLKPVLKLLLENRQNKGLNDKW